MKIQNLVYKNNWITEDATFFNKEEVDVIFVFGTRETIKKEEVFLQLQELFKNAIIVGASSCGNILNEEVSTYEAIASAVTFKSSHVKFASQYFSSTKNTEALTKEVIDQLPKKDLKHIFVLYDALACNGSHLVKALNALNLPISITGGGAGDDLNFEETYVLANKKAQKNVFLALAFYGEDLEITSGINAGWSEFGKQRVVTKSIENVVYEIDNEPALDLYERYLQEEAKNLPASALKFPLSIKKENSKFEVIRTVLSVDKKDKSITFVGNVPNLCMARLMRADIDMLIQGAKNAALDINKANNKTALALVVSCVGRINVMNQLVDDELEIIAEVLGQNVKLCGFYSYGELGPFKKDLCTTKFHNQTMTITSIYEN